MQKIAQRRGILNKLRESTNIGGIAAEKFFNPEFQAIMDELRDKVDDPIRAIASGEQIGMASPPADAISLKELLKSVKSFINRREYMRAVTDLGRFHKKMYDISKLLSGFKGNVDKVHEKFLFGDLSSEEQKHLVDLKNRFAAKSPTSFIKEANILDFFTNIGTERGRALASWEKRYPKQLKKLKNDTISLLSQSERLLGITLSTLKGLASARATRNPDKYIAESDKIIKAYKIYDESFKTYYQENIKGFLDNQAFAKPPEPVQPIPVTVDDSVVDSMAKTVPQPPVLESLPVASPPVTSVNSQPPQFNVPSLQQPKPQVGTELELPENSPITLKSPIPAVPVKDKPVNVAHQAFMKSLEVFSKESPTFLLSHIIKYAKSIEITDPETSIQLFKIAKSIKG